MVAVAESSPRRNLVDAELAEVKQNTRVLDPAERRERCRRLVHRVVESPSQRPLSYAGSARELRCCDRSVEVPLYEVNRTPDDRIVRDGIGRGIGQLRERDEDQSRTVSSVRRQRFEQRGEAVAALECVDPRADFDRQTADGEMNVEVIDRTVAVR